MVPLHQGVQQLNILVVLTEIDGLQRDLDVLSAIEVELRLDAGRKVDVRRGEHVRGLRRQDVVREKAITSRLPRREDLLSNLYLMKLELDGIILPDNLI